jgi:hypothetical protein
MIRLHPVKQKNTGFLDVAYNIKIFLWKNSRNNVTSHKKNMSCPLLHVNWISVVLLTVFSFVLGALWHSPLLFGKAWKKEIQIKDEEGAKTNYALIFGLSGLLNFIAILALGIFVGPDSTAAAGLLKGLMVGFGWVLPAMGVTYLFAQRSLRLFLIDAGFYLLLFILSGLILGSW